MVLTTHAIVGGALAKASGAGPVAALVMGFLSHLLLDAIPHWDYNLRSKREDENDKLSADMEIGKIFYQDLIIIGADFVFGLSLAIFFFSGISSWQELLSSGVFWGALGGVLPDALQFVYFKYRKEPIKSFQYFHTVFIHSPKKIESVIWGPIAQIALILLVVSITLY